MKTVAFCLASFILFLTSVHAVNIDFVTVGNPGNAPETRYIDSYHRDGFGTVDHFYRIGKYEITAGQYTEFLNAVAATDTLGLYNTSMRDWTGIQRNGPRGSFEYSVAADWANRPVNYVSFWDAARFVNWLHNGQPTGPVGPNTTEEGAYSKIGDPVNFARQPGAKFFIPTEDEWYKAGYYDPNRDGPKIGGYWSYPTGTDVMPSNDITETTNPGNNANYSKDGHTIGGPYYLTEVGEFELSMSPYGTFDQAGNVWEWSEKAVQSSLRGVLGNGYSSIDLDYVHEGYRGGNDSLYESRVLGFRVASAIPEPNAICLTLLGTLGVLLRRAARI